MIPAVDSTYKAWTLEFLTNRHHNQHSPLMTTVPSMILRAGMPLEIGLAQSTMTIEGNYLHFNQLVIRRGQSLYRLQRDLNERSDHDDWED